MDEIINHLIRANPSTEVSFDWHATNTAAQIGFDTLKEYYLKDKAEGTDLFKKARTKGKAVGLAFCYGGTAFMLRRSYPELSEKEAQDMEKAFFNRLPVFKKYLEQLLKKAEKTLTVNTFMGRNIPVTGLQSDKWFEKNEAKNGVYNYPIQGGGGELIRLILIEMSNWIERNRMYALQNNLICDNFATRIVSFQMPDDGNIFDELESYLDSCPDGNTLVLICYETSVLYEFDRPVKLDMTVATKFNVKVEF